MPVLILHSGAGGEPDPDRRRAIARELVRIGDLAWAKLAHASALDVVVEATRLLEDVPFFNAGRGSKLQEDGVARLSAALMCGDTLRFSGVVGIEGFLNPILACPALLDARDRVLMGEGAARWAQEQGLERGDARTERRIEEWRSAKQGKSGTVGALALDAGGRLASAISTGGRGGERVGRMSDSPTVAGNYASAMAAAGMTGIGEQIVDGALAVRLVAAVEGGESIRSASQRLMGEIRSRTWEVGMIGLSADGTWIADSSVWMGWRAYDSSGVYCTP